MTEPNTTAPVAMTDADIPAVTLHLTGLFDELKATPDHVATVASHLLVIASHEAGRTMADAEAAIIAAFRKGYQSLADFNAAN